jgi:hypothetical protein
MYLKVANLTVVDLADPRINDTAFYFSDDISPAIPKNAPSPPIRLVRKAHTSGAAAQDAQSPGFLTSNRNENSFYGHPIMNGQDIKRRAKAVPAKDVESCSTTLSIPQRLAMSTQPPEATRPGIELSPPPQVRLLQPEDIRNMWATAVLLRNGTDVTDQLGGELNQSPGDDGKTFCFSGLTILSEGIYCLKIILYCMDFDSYHGSVIQVGCLVSNDIEARK